MASRKNSVLPKRKRLETSPKSYLSLRVLHRRSSKSLNPDSISLHRYTEFFSFFLVKLKNFWRCSSKISSPIQSSGIVAYSGLLWQSSLRNFTDIRKKIIIKTKSMKQLHDFYCFTFINGLWRKFRLPPRG